MQIDFDGIPGLALEVAEEHRLATQDIATGQEDLIVIGEDLQPSHDSRGRVQILPEPELTT
jgi:hypothetical protein